MFWSGLSFITTAAIEDTLYLSRNLPPFLLTDYARIASRKMVTFEILLTTTDEFWVLFSVVEGLDVQKEHKHNLDSLTVSEFRGGHSE